MIRDPFALYRQPKMKRLLNQLLMLAITISILYTVAELALIFNFDIMSWIGSPSFVTMLIVVILGWVGYLMLNGKFQAPVEYQEKKRPQQKRQQPQYRPSEIQVDTCSFCSKEYPLKALREFKDKDGYRILLCNECLK